MTAASPEHGDVPRRVIYGLVAAGFTVMFVSSSIKSVYQVYFASLADFFDCGRAGLAWSGSAFMLVTGVASPLVGALSDRYGPLNTVAVGAVTAGIGLVAASVWQASLPVFTLAYGVAGAFGLAAMTYVPMGVLVDRLFEERRTGLAYAVVTNGTSVGFIVLSPFWLWLQPLVSWQHTFLTVGLLFVGPLACGVWLLSRLKPAQAGLQVAADSRNADARPVSTWRRIRTDPGFYALAIGFFGCGATMAFIDVHLVAFWQGEHALVRQMSGAMMLLGVLELTSGLATGWLAARYDRRRLLAAFYLLRAVSMTLLFSSTDEVRTWCFGALFGASYLGTVVLTSMFCLERYGIAIKGRVFGILFFVHQIGAFCAVQFGAIGFDRSGSYRSLITALALLTVASAVSVWVGLRKPTRATPAERRPA